MDNRAYESSAAGTPPAFPAMVVGYPMSSTSTLPATVPGPWWFHMIGEEMRTFIVKTGQAPDPYNSDQLLQGLQNLLGQ